MSLVGPRPEMEMHVSAAFRSHCRHDIRPGLTGPFQLSDMRARGDLIAGLRLDEHYVRHISPRYDLVLMVRTFGAVFRGTGG
jgi:lipopolysaccharide/colanic/teichoic acid biosynthesis glycosyltransferase